MPGEIEMGSPTLVEGEHRTPSGRVSMDPIKWRVAQVLYQTVQSTTALWGIFPPQQSYPIQSTHTYAEAIERAARYAYFKVVPPPQDSEPM